MQTSEVLLLVAFFAAEACANTENGDANDPNAAGAGGNAGGSTVPSAGSGGGSGTGDAGIAQSTPDGGATTTETPAIFRICGFSTGAMGGSCDGLNAYIACVEDHCESALMQCFGDGYTVDDYTGGTCAEYANCATAAPDPCNADCSPNTDCQQCLGDLVECMEGSTCALPLCSGTTNGTGGTGGIPDAGTSIMGTCSDLEACCASLSDSTYRDACNTALSDALAARGDEDCAIVYSTYKAAGACN